MEIGPYFQLNSANSLIQITVRDRVTSWKKKNIRGPRDVK